MSSIQEPLVGAPIAVATGPLEDDWTTFAHDQERTGYQAQQIGLSQQNASGLSLRWKYTASEPIYSSPLAYGGLVLVATYGSGTVIALNAKTGSVVWTQTLGGQVTGTPTIADGMVFLGTHLFSNPSAGVYLAAPSSVYALNLLTGTVIWKTGIASQNRSSPIVANGLVYFGVAGGDPPTCLQGGVDALDEMTGASVWTWKVNPASSGGGAVWGALAYDGSRVIAGTGNACSTPVSTSNSIVALDPSTGNLDWTLVAQQNSVSDDDTGSGVMINGSNAYAMSKDGSMYAVGSMNGALSLSKQLNPNNLYGGWSTPATDGSTIVLGTGLYDVSAAAADEYRFRIRPTIAPRRAAAMTGSYGMLQALDFGGNVKWSVQTQNQVAGSAALCNGVAIAGIDQSVTVFNLATGARLFSYPTPALVDASPAVVPSGVYAADMAGNVYAFALPSSETTARKR